jgi:protein SCO1/2
MATPSPSKLPPRPCRTNDESMSLAPACNAKAWKLVARGTLLLAVLFLSAGTGWAGKTYSATCLVLKVDKAHQSFVASCQSIPGYMEAMVMPYPVRDPKELEGLAPGMMIDFTLVVEQDSAYPENIHVREFQSVEQDPLTARRLKLLDGAFASPSSPKALQAGESVPEFALTDQNRHHVALSQFSGKVVLLNFIYTRCALPNFCFRIANNFGVLQKRFKTRMGRDLVFLTVTFDPVHDTPEALAHYAEIWKADPKTWYFLTGATSDVQRICKLFGVDFFPDEGLMDHSLHTAIIDPAGKLVTNLEGNEFTADQLGDLVQTVLERPQDR